MKNKILTLVLLCIAAGCNNPKEKAQPKTYEGADLVVDSLEGYVLGMDTSLSHRNHGNYGAAGIVVMTYSLDTASEVPDTLIIPLSGFSASNMLNVMWDRNIPIDFLSCTIPALRECTRWPIRPHYIQVRYHGGGLGNPTPGPEIYFQ